MNEAIQVAAKWWADNLGAAHDNGDAHQSAFANMCSSLLPPITQEQRQIFEAALSTLLETETHVYTLHNKGEGSSICVGVDYGPDQILADAARSAGITASLHFPCKTVMWLYKDAVCVVTGYRAPIKTIWSKKEKGEQ